MAFSTLSGISFSTTTNKSNSTTSVVDKHQLEYKAEIARGGMGEVSLYFLHKNGSSREVAVKTLFKGSITERELISLKKEMKILRCLNHDNIIKTLGVADTRFGFGIVLEYLPYGSYSNYFQTFWKYVRKTNQMQEMLVPFKVRLLKEVIDAMDYLHGFDPQKKILHLDLKCENVLLTGSLHAKICDFGMSKLSTLTELQIRATTETDKIGGTPGYIAPERFLLQNTKPTSKWDVYSFGILEFTVLADSAPYPEHDMQNFHVLHYHISQYGKRPDMNRIPSIYPMGLISMMQECWQAEPSKRPDFSLLNRKISSIKLGIADFESKATAAVEEIMRILEKEMPSDVYSTWTTSIKSNDQLIVSCGCLDSDIEEYHSSSQIYFEEKRQEISSLELSHSFNSRIEDARISPQRSGAFRWSKRSIIITAGVITVLAVIAAGILAITSIKSSSGIIVSGRDNCHTLNPPPRGSIHCRNTTDNDTTVCQLTCDEGYIVSGGEENITCVGEEWIHRVPSCEAKCQPLQEVQYAKLSCTNELSVGSTCKYTCVDEQRYLHGKNSTTCLENNTWSNQPPSCKCSECSVGDYCEFSIRWQDVLEQLCTNELNLHRVQFDRIYYGENSFTCITNLYWDVYASRWSTICYVGSGELNASSNGWTSPRNSSIHAALKFIKLLSNKQIYPFPCDPETMNKTECDDKLKSTTTFKPLSSTISSGISARQLQRHHLYLLLVLELQFVFLRKVICSAG